MGQRTLTLSRARVWELFKEVFEKELSSVTAGHVEKALRTAMLKSSKQRTSSRAKGQSPKSFRSSKLNRRRN